jgi:hypothetical protein
MGITQAPPEPLEVGELLDKFGKDSIRDILLGVQMK